MTKRELALDFPAIRERVAAGEEMWLGLSRDEAALLLAEIDRTAAALAAAYRDYQVVEEDRDSMMPVVEAVRAFLLVPGADDDADALVAAVERVAAAEQDRDRLAIQRDNVLSLHVEYEGRCTYCLEHCDCLQERGMDARIADCHHGWEEWPCPTVRAIGSEKDARHEDLRSELGRTRDELTVVRRERAWLLANLSEAELAEFRLLAQTAERAREDAAPDVYCTACGGIALCVDGDWTHEESARNTHQAEPPEDDGTCTRCGLGTVDGDGHWVACENNPLGRLTDLIGIAPDRDGTEAGAFPIAGPEEPEWLVWSNAQDAWWGPNSAGYRQDVMEAGRYTEADALKAINMRTWDKHIPPEVMVLAPSQEQIVAMVGTRKLAELMRQRIDDATQQRIREERAGQ